MSGPGRHGLLGGTFDPPHLGHLVLAAAAWQQLRLDDVLFVPAGDPWRKSSRREVTPGDLRLRLVRAAVADLPWAGVSDLELRREGPSYTTETLETLGRQIGGEWWFIIGADALVDMPHWREPERILRAARLALAPRPGEEDVARFVPEAPRRSLPGVEQRIDLVTMPLLEISSTDLRARVREGRPTEFLLPAGVRELVDELGLYRSGSDEEVAGPPAS